VAGLSLMPPWLRFSGMTIYCKGRWQWWARVASPQADVARVGPRPLWVSPSCCSSHLLLLATFILWYYRNFWVFLWNCWSSEIWCLDGPFSSRILTPAANPLMIIKHVKTKETT
jgi:hypothetical protein